MRLSSSERALTRFLPTNGSIEEAACSDFGRICCLRQHFSHGIRIGLVKAYSPVNRALNSQLQPKVGQTMKKKSFQIILLAMLVASVAPLLPTTAQPSAAYQAEEQAFRARQEEGSRLHRTYGENSPQYQEWLHREKGSSASQQPYPAYQGNQGYPGYQGNYKSHKKHKKDRHCKNDNNWNNSNNWHNNNNATNTSSWNWDAHNWKEQKDYLKCHWRRHDEHRMSAQQQQQLDAQMRAQWMQYHNNKWQGNPTWNQYSDPGFLDYIHNRNPGLLQTLRTQIGF